MVLLCTIAGLGIARPARALFREDFEQAYFVDPQHTVADHCLVKKDGVWHIFYTMGPYGSASAVLQDTLGHATTTDFIHWDIRPGILPVPAAGWDSRAHWAPEVVSIGDTLWYMLFTGVDNFNSQQIGVATSRDLETWTPYAGNPVFHPDTTWTNWRPGAWGDCRDPCVFRVGATWYMAYTATSTYGKGSIGYASSPDLLHWTDLGALLIHPSGPTSWFALESPLLMPHNSGWSMVFTEANVGGSAALFAANFTGPWDYNSRVIIDRGAALCAPIDPNSGQQWFSRHRAESVNDTTRFFIKVDSLVWNGNLPAPRFHQPFPQWTWNGLAFIEQSTFLDSRVKVRPPVQQIGSGWLGTSEGWQGPLQLGTPGLSLGDSITGVAQTSSRILTGDSLTVLISGGDSPDSTALRVCDPCTGRILHSESGRRTDRLERRTWPTGHLRGQVAYFQMIDYARGAWGHLNLDDLREVLATGGDSTPVTLAVPVVDVPSAGESFEIGVPDTLRWHPSRATTLDSTWVLLSRDNGVTFPEHVATLAGGASELVWTPGGSAVTSAVLRVVFWHQGTLTSCATSAPFTLCASGVSEVFAANVAGTTASIFWTTTTPSVGVIDFGLDGELGRSATEVTALPRTVHAVTVGQLTPDSRYIFRIRGCGSHSALNGPRWTFHTAGSDSVPGSYVVLGTLAANDSLQTNYVSVLAWTRRGNLVSTPVGLLAPVGSTWSLDLARGRDPFTGAGFAPVAGDSITVAVFEGGALSGWISTNVLDGTSPQTITSAPLLTGAGEPGDRGGPLDDVLAFGEAGPQPGRSGQPVRFILQGSRAAVTQVGIYDVRGRRVRQMTLPPQHATARVFEWDARDDAGRPVPAGVYRVVARTMHARAVRSVLLLQ